MSIFVLILLLSNSIANFGGLAFPPPIGLSAIESGPCTDPRFVAAEHEAFLAMSRSRNDAARELADKITDLEATYKKKSDEKDRSYHRKLGECASDDGECTLKAKRDHDSDMIDIQRTHDQGIYDAQGEEQAAIAAAQTIYNAKVEEARRLYCGKSCQGEWTGTITYRQTKTVSSKKTIIPHQSAWSKTEGGEDNTDITTTYSGTIYLDGRNNSTSPRVFNANLGGSIAYDYIAVNTESIYGQVWCSPLQGFKSSHGEASTINYGNGKGSDPTNVVINFDPATYTIYVTPPSVVVQTGHSYRNSSGNACKNNKPISDSNSSTGKGNAGPGALPSVKKPYGPDHDVLSDTATVTYAPPATSSSSATSTITSSTSTVTTITWNLKRCH